MYGPRAFPLVISPVNASTFPSAAVLAEWIKRHDGWLKEKLLQHGVSAPPPFPTTHLSFLPIPPHEVYHSPP